VRILITGATGFLGAHVVRALSRRRHTLRALARSTSRTEAIEAEGVEVVRASFDDRAGVRRALDGVECVVHAAGGGMGSAESIHASNAGSTAALLAEMASGVRFVLVSSLAAHGPSAPGRPATEGEADRPRSTYGRSKLAAEALALRQDRPTVILRPPALYGPGERRLVPLFSAARRGMLPMLHPEGTLSLLDGRDCAEAIAAACETERTGVYYVAEREPYTRRRFAELIGEAVGRRIRVLPIPESAFTTAGALAEIAGSLRGRPFVLSRDKAADAAQPHQSCNPSRAIEALAWEPAHAFPEGARETYADYVARGWM